MNHPDPIECNVPLINQFQVQEKVGLTFSTALRTLLRQDPDVIMLGEIRDEETARTAIQAALTGHLVFSTLHTNDALRDAIVAGKSAAQIRRLAADNLITLRHDGFRKIREGITTIEEVVQVAGDIVQSTNR